MMNFEKPQITYAIQDSLGGILYLNKHLIDYGNKAGCRQHVSFFWYEGLQSSRFNKPFDVASSNSFLTYSKLDNLYHVFRAYKDQMPAGPGALVSNNEFELLMIHTLGTEKTIFQIVHDAHNLELSKRHQGIIDVFIAHNRYIESQLKKCIPDRSQDIFYLPYGIQIPKIKRGTSGKRLKLVFLGRLTGKKGIFDLSKIDKGLRANNLLVDWLIIGRGPASDAIRKSFSENGRIVYCSPDEKSEVFERLSEGDLLIFPTMFEGTPIALIEAMSLGLVPLVNNIPSGIAEVVPPNAGFLIDPANIDQYIKIILMLNDNRERIDAMGEDARGYIQKHHEFDSCFKKYFKLFLAYEHLKKELPTSNYKPFGSRLDKRWIPNCCVRILRRLIYKQNKSSA